MSYFNDLRYQMELNHKPILNDCPFDYNKVELEDLSSNFKKFKDFFIKVLKWIKDKLVKLFLFLKEKIGKWIKSKLFKEKVKRFEIIQKSGFLSSSELVEIIRNSLSVKHIGLESSFDISPTDIQKGVNDFRNKYNDRNALYRSGFFFTPQGQLRDINKIIDRVEEVIVDIWNKEDEYLIKKYGVGYFNNRINYAYEQFNFSHFILGEGSRDDIYIGKGFQIDVQDFCQKVLHFEQDYHYAEDELGLYKKKIEDRINKFSDKISGGVKQKDKIINEKELDKYRLLLMIINIPITFMMHFARLIDEVSKIAFSEKYITTDKLSDVSTEGELYHVSTNDNLVKNKNGLQLLKARLPENGRHQFLPERISFSPTIKGCFTGVPAHMRNLPVKYISEDVRSVVLNLYEGIPIKGKTRYLKPELLRFTIIHPEIYTTHEVAVFNEIKIKFIGKVEYLFSTDLSIPDHKRYINHILL